MDKSDRPPGIGQDGAMRSSQRTTPFRLARLLHTVAVLAGITALVVGAAGCAKKHSTGKTTPTSNGATTIDTGSVGSAVSTSTGPTTTTASTTPRPSTTTSGTGPENVPVGNGLDLKAPQGWTWVPYGKDGSGCVAPSHPESSPCPGVEVRRGASLATATANGPYQPDAPYGWSTLPAPPPCPDGSGTATANSVILSSQTKTVDGQPADFRAWRTTCANGYSTIIERWNVASKGVLFTNFAADPGADVILRATFS